jgi:2-polyprenyl-3-methyl-5-hydroxy-6-metoxy-1,4-benzoquinol methylase
MIQSPTICEEELSKSYSTYYTHQTVSNKTLLFSLLKRVRDGYLAKKYDIKLDDAISLGYYPVIALPFLKSGIDAHDCRHIEKCNSKEMSLLDFGCGSGKFMSFAAKLGWRAVGYDLDENAINIAKSKGCNVIRGDVNAMAEIPNKTFNYITLSHVIEHVRDPLLLLKECNRILSDDGAIWIETPNNKSIGCIFFRKYWRGIEAPRHLYIFNQNSLSKMLSKCGFTDVTVLHRGGVIWDMYSQSLRAYCGRDVGIFIKIILIIVAPIFELLTMAFKSKAEFITLTASKKNK